MRITLLLPALLLCASCAHHGSVAPPPPPAMAGWITPAEAVHAANDDPQRGISGTFVINVRAVDLTDHGLYLNSETDYRHQANLTVWLAPGQADALRARLDNLPLDRLVNRRLLLQGTARREKIIFSRDGVPSDKYYYQTHVRLSDPRQARFAP